MATARESVFYAATWTNKYLADARKYDGRVVPLPFDVTLISAAATGDTYKVTVIPANARVIDAYVVTDGLGASAGTGTGVIVGDSGDTDRYVATFDADAAGASGRLAFAGSGYTPTADTIVLVTVTGTVVAGKKVSGYLLVIPGV